MGVKRAQLSRGGPESKRTAILSGLSTQVYPRETRILTAFQEPEIKSI